MSLKIRLISKNELKYQVWALLFMASGIFLLCFILFGTDNLSRFTAGIIIERFLPLIGIFGLTTFFYPEHQRPVKDLLNIRKTKIEMIYLIRMIIFLIIYGGFSYLYISLMMKNFQQQFILKTLLYSLSIGILIGAIGMLTFSLSRHISLAFLLVIGVVLLQWFMPKDKMEIFYLFTFSQLSPAHITGLLLPAILLVRVSLWHWKRCIIA